MRLRALIAMALFESGCTPSTDLASYSEGLEPQTGESTSPAAAPPSAVQGVDGEAQGSGSAESVLPEMFEGGSPAGSSGGPVPAGDEEPEAPGEAVTSPEEEPSAEPEPERRFRFVRLVADSAVQGPFTSIAELNVLDESGEPIDRSEWAIEADSEELVWVGGAPAALAIDGVATSMWHTAWFEVEPAPAHPHSLEIDLGRAHAVSGFRYLPRQDGSLDGRIAEYRLFVSVDGVTWGEPVAAGTLANTDAEQEIQLDP
jgi:hypothetical protein